MEICENGGDLELFKEVFLVEWNDEKLLDKENVFLM